MKFTKVFTKPIGIITICVLIYSASTAYGASFVSVTGDNINVRNGPGTNYGIIMELFKGYPLKVIDSQGDWRKVVDFENDQGWIHKSLITNGNTVIVNGKESVNMRAEPSTKGQIIANVDRGVVMIRLEKRGNWLKLKHASGVIGWIYKPLLWP